MNFDMMSYSQIASLIIAIVFSVISLATSIFAFRYVEKIKSKGILVTFTLLFPFIAMIGWFFLLFSFMDWLKERELVNFVFSTVLSAIIIFMIIVVSKALFARYFNLTEEEMEAKRAEKAAKKAAKREQKLLGYTQTKTEVENNEDAIEELIVEENEEIINDESEESVDNEEIVESEENVDEVIDENVESNEIDENIIDEIEDNLYENEDIEDENDVIEEEIDDIEEETDDENKNEDDDDK